MHDLCECALRIINASQCEQHHPQVVERSETRRLVLVELEGAPNVDDGFGNLSTNQESGSQRMLGVRLDFSLFSCPRFRRDLVERLLGHRQIAARLHRECAPHPAEEDGVNIARSLPRSEEHTSELQSPCNLVCRLLLEKKKIK